MRTAATILVLLALGCSKPAALPQTPAKLTPVGQVLRYLSYGVGSSVNPIQFGLRVAHDGAALDVDAVDAILHKGTVVGDVESGAISTTVDYFVKLMRPGSGGALELAGPDKAVTLKSGETTDLLLVIAWKMPDNPPTAPALASVC